VTGAGLSAAVSIAVVRGPVEPALETIGTWIEAQMKQK
jgi:hypothetical protein